MARAIALQSSTTAILLGPRFKSRLGRNIIIPFLGDYIIKDSNYCFNSSAIRLRSKDLKHLTQVTGYPNYRVSIHVMLEVYKTLILCFVLAWLKTYKCKNLQV